jgi:hypothetical protein
MYTRKSMGDKLYWRTKKDGKWTWVPAHVVDDEDRSAYRTEDGYVIAIARWYYGEDEE